MRANEKDGNRRRTMTMRKRDKRQKVKEEQLNKTDGTKYKIRRQDKVSSTSWYRQSGPAAAH